MQDEAHEPITGGRARNRQGSPDELAAEAGELAIRSPANLRLCACVQSSTVVHGRAWGCCSI